QLNASGVTAAGPDVVVLATGGQPLIPEIPGSDGTNVVAAPDVLTGKVMTGQRVLVAGGGLIGCETALFLDALGKDVFVVEMTAELAGDQVIVPREALLRKLDQTRVEYVTSATITEFTEDGVIVEREANREIFIGMDTVVLAMGIAPVNDLARAIRDSESEIHVIGDAEAPCNAMDAIAAGARIGRRI
ncbi:MAG: FAD-dependent oxidoreductase, partial [Deltaproteobacteria bacterium]|nr:FAD-dependent oxidoreductase [Deltaproteobacteria bacterium]